ncbi:hypothetical protein ACFY3O_27830 [Streptomyces sp. NPDC001046]|uniref:hypothetical protein n=1 Tax=Streptomyces sp. NPDC001046 TaxID=3364543 RepID=UPI0036A5A60A
MDTADSAGGAGQPCPGLEVAADAGEINAVHLLGPRLRAAGEEQQARLRYRRAVEPDSPGRPHVLGLPFAGDGDLAEARV